MAVAGDDAAANSDKKSRPANGLGPDLEHVDFFAANGISPPSTLFEEMSDTFYFARNKAGKFVWGNRLLQEKHRLAPVSRAPTSTHRPRPVANAQASQHKSDASTCHAAPRNCAGRVP